MNPSVDENKYYFEYLKRTRRFPQSVYHQAKHQMVRYMFEGLKPGAKVLDAACGIGHVTAEYSNAFDLVGLDEQLSAIRYCCQNSKARYLQGSLYNIPFADNEFDMIVFLDAIEHFTDPVSALRELNRVLKPEGKILICTINYANPLWIILENTWHRFFGGNCKSYSKDVHPSRYTQRILRKHCGGIFEEVDFRKRILKMELFYIGKKSQKIVCGHISYQEYRKFNNNTLYKCNNCGFVFTSNSMKKIDPHALYEEYYKEGTGGRFNFGLEYFIRAFRFFRALKIFTIHHKAKSILDIGSGRGFMLYYLKKYFRYRLAIGTQLSKNAVIFSRKKLGLEIFDQDFLKLPLDNLSFDVVTLWHVLEHVPHPEEYISKIYRCLNEKGSLAIEVPNLNSWTAGLTGPYWLGLDLNYHLYFFSPATLSRLFEKYDFEIKNVHTFSLEYSIFISISSIVSWLTRTDHLLFNWLQKGKFTPVLFWHIFLFILFFPPCLLINLLLFFSKKGEILLIVGQKNSSV